MEFSGSKLGAKLALESLIALCQQEIRNMDRFEDERQLIATCDLQRRFNFAIEMAELFERGFEASRTI